MGDNRRERQRPDRPADVRRGRARPRLAARRERVRRTRVAGRFDRGNRGATRRGSPRDDGRTPRSWSSMTCTSCTTRAASAAVAELPGTSPRARSWCSLRRGAPALPLGRAEGAGPRGRDRCMTSCAWTRPRRASSCGRRPGPDRCRAGRAHRTHGGLGAGLYLAALSAKRNGPGERARSEFAGRRPFRRRVSPLRGPLAAAARRTPLPDADRRSRAHVGPSVRRRAGVERLGGGAGVARTLEPVRRPAGQQRALVSLPPSLPGNCSARSWSEPSRSSCRVLLARAVAWSAANGQPEAAIGYAQEVGDVDAVSRLVGQCALPAYTERPFRGRGAMARAGWRNTERSNETRPSPCSARCSPRSWGRPVGGGALGRRGRTRHL